MSSSSTQHPPLQASTEPFKTYTPEEKSELATAESEAASTWQAWHDAKTKGDTEPAELQRMLELAEKKQEELKGLQSLC